jgi:hypothetical protein
MSNEEPVNLNRMWNKTLDQIETERIEGLSDRRHEARIKEYQEKNFIVLSLKEVEILRGRISNEILILLNDSYDNPEYFDGFNLSKTELIEFKKKLEKLLDMRE